RDTGVVDENVDAAEGLHRLAGHLCAVGFLGDVGAQVNRAGADALEFGAGLLHRFDRTRRDYNFRAGCSVLQRDLFADSVAAAGDDCDFIREFVHGDGFLGRFPELVTAPTLVASRRAHNACAEPCLSPLPPNIIERSWRRSIQSELTNASRAQTARG